MNTALIHIPRRSPFKSTRTHPVGRDTQNVSFSIGRHKIPVNLYDQAVAIMDEVFTGNRSEWIKQAIAREITRVDVWRGLAFRAACKLSASFKSIFAPSATPEDQEPIFLADVEKFKAEVNQPENQTPGLVLIEDLTKLKPSGEYEPTK